MPTLDHLLDRLGLELGRVPRRIASHLTSVCLIVRLYGVYGKRGDSSISSRPTMVTDCGTLLTNASERVAVTVTTPSVRSAVWAEAAMAQVRAAREMAVRGNFVESIGQIERK
ncbi:MAG: hypothetical protein ACLGHB_08040 [Gammaproteobacteria bacterium]